MQFALASAGQLQCKRCDDVNHLNITPLSFYVCTELGSGVVESALCSCCATVMLVACSEFNTMAVYLTHLLNVHTGDTFTSSIRIHKKIAQSPHGSIACSAYSAVTVSKDGRCVVYCWMKIRSDVRTRTACNRNSSICGFSKKFTGYIVFLFLLDLRAVYSVSVVF